MRQLQSIIKSYWPTCVLITMILFLSSCMPEETLIGQRETPTGSQLPTLRPTSTDRPGGTTATPPSISTIMMKSTPMPSGTPTTTLVPTITSIEREAVFANFMATNGGCDLPCWWGIELGDSMESVNQTFINLGIAPLVIGNSSKVDSDRMGSRSAYYADYYEDEQHGPRADVRLSFNMQFHELDGAIEYIYIFVNNPRDVPMPPEFFRDWEQYYVSSFLQRYGQPTQVYFRVRSIGDPMDPPQYSVSLLYLDQGLAITYHIQGTSDELCLDIENVVALELSLFNPEGLERWGDNFAPYNDEGYATLTWEAEISESLDTFYETYQDPANLNCIQIP